MYFVVHPQPGTDEQLNDRIREVADKINKYGPQVPNTLQSLKGPVKQIVIGPTHIGILLEDGHAYRVAFSVIPDRLDLSKQEPNKGSGGSGGGGPGGGGGGSGSSGGNGGPSGSGSGAGGSGGAGPSSGGSGLGGSGGNNSSSAKSSAARQLQRSRARIMRATSAVRTNSGTQSSGSRSTGVIIGSSSGRSLVSVPAPFVPEELISQAQVVLQGKSRNVIIRELQRTNLDVNLAVNNLLSRDDEESEDLEDNTDNYVPEDLISLLDNGFHSDNSVIIDADAMFSEEIIGYSSIRNRAARSDRLLSAAAMSEAARAQTGTSATGSGGAAGGGTGTTSSGGTGSGGGGNINTLTSMTGSGNNTNSSGNSGGTTAGVNTGSFPLQHERDSFTRWRDRHHYGPRRWFQRDDNYDKDADVSKKKDVTSGLPLWISDDLEMWPECDLNGPVRFTKIASLYSEFLAVSTKGVLHQWRWADPEPYKHSEYPTIFHPKALSLSLLFEKITHVSATLIRCTVATESNRVATWMDDVLGHLGSKLEHNASLFTDFQNDKIMDLYTCTMYTVARTESSQLYFWGVLPFGQRKRLWDKHKAKSKKPNRNTASSASSSSSSDITVGAQVCMKNCPLYQAGAIGFTVANGIPRVGQLLNSAWDLTDTCRFQVLTIGPSSSFQTNSTVTTTSLTSTTVTTTPTSSSSSASSSTNTNAAMASQSSVPSANNTSINGNNSNGNNSIANGNGAATSASASTSTSSSSASSSSSAPTSSGKSSGNNKETADRIDMPPPPSPASSTCSDTGSVTSLKRQKRAAPKEDNDAKGQENWLLRDVVFLEDVRTISVGKVVQVDGQYAAVRFYSSGNVPETKDENESWQDCRLMKKDDLQLLKTATNNRNIPDCLQKTPRRIMLTPNQSTGSGGGAGTATSTASDNTQPPQLLTVAVDSKGIHAIMKTGTKLHYCLFNMNTGRQEHDSIFPTDYNAFLGISQNNISLTCANESEYSVLILRDGNNTIYPLSKDCLDAIRDPQWVDLQPIKCMAAASVTLQSVGANLKSEVAVIILVPDIQLLMPRILRCDLKGFLAALNQLDNASQSGSFMPDTKDIKDINAVLNERCDGNRNILHACVSMCSPTSNKDDPIDTNITVTNNASGSGSNVNTTAGTAQSTNSAPTSSSSQTFQYITMANSSNNSNSAANDTNNSERSESIRDMVRRHRSQAAESFTADESTANNQSFRSSPPFWSSEYLPNPNDKDNLCDLRSNVMSNGQSKTNIHTNVYISDAVERRDNAMKMLDRMCQSKSLMPYLKLLLSSKDAQGQTPFMLAITSRAYHAGLTLLSVILQIAKNDANARDAMIFPTGSSPDHSPLYVLCCNDTCSFTWTGADHINQDIFECKTCGLTGSLCCCTECAKICHKGHDCKLKRTSPTAYCDCWEKCKCKALITGDQSKRLKLLNLLVEKTDLVKRLNSRGEPILLFLTQTVGRQILEQKQYRIRPRNVSSYNRKTPLLDNDTDMPDHDLEPPKFARKALDLLLLDWQVVKSMIMIGTESEKLPSTIPNKVYYNETDDQALYLQSQSGTTLLDKFTHILFVRCNTEPLDTLLITLTRELQNNKIPGRIDEAYKITRRFIRSVTRLFVIFSLERLPTVDKQRTSIQQKHIQTCRRVFNTLLKISMEELMETAVALIAPVRMGVVRPTAPFAMASPNIDSSYELFNVEPLAPSTSSSGSNNLDSRSSPLMNMSGQNGNGFLNSNSNFRMRPFNDNVDPDANMDNGREDDGEASELDELPPTRIVSLLNRSVNNIDEDVQDPLRNEDGAQDGESDNDYFVEGDTDSDSDDNRSTQEVQRSVQTGGATAGSDTGIVNEPYYINLDDSDGSSQPDEDGSDDGETDAHSTEDFNLVPEHRLERRNPISSAGNNAAPQSMQWAIRNRETNRSGVRIPSGSSLVFIDPAAIRRTTGATAAVTTQDPQTMSTTASSLARAFGIVLRQICQLFNSLNVYYNSGVLYNMNLTYQEANALHQSLELRLKPIWDWILTVMDATEAQLRFGASLTHISDPSHPLHPLNPTQPATTTTTTTSSAAAAAAPPGTIHLLGSSVAPPSRRPLDGNAQNPTSANSRIVGFSTNSDSHRNFEREPVAPSARREFLSYALSLMRSHSSEHRDSLPFLDVTALRHIAYVLDGIIFYMRGAREPELDKTDSFWMEQDEIENDEMDEDMVISDTDLIDEEDLMGNMSGSRHLFFQRSESTLCLGCPPPDPFSTKLTTALPLAEQPHLLLPNARREDLFGIPKQPITIPANNSTSTDTDDRRGSPLELPPIRLGLSATHKYDETSSLTGASNGTPDATSNDANATDVNDVNERMEEDVSKNSTIDRSVVSQLAMPTNNGEQLPLANNTQNIATMSSQSRTTNTSSTIPIEMNAQTIPTDMNDIISIDLTSSYDGDGSSITAVAPDNNVEEQYLYGTNNLMYSPTNPSNPANWASSVKETFQEQQPSTSKTDRKILSSSAGSSSSVTIPGTNKRKLSDHSDGYGNIYMQLKKKNYYDQYDDESNKNMEKRDEGPQDLTCTKESAQQQQPMKMEIDNEINNFSCISLNAELQMPKYGSGGAFASTFTAPPSTSSSASFSASTSTLKLYPSESTSTLDQSLSSTTSSSTSSVLSPNLQTPTNLQNPSSSAAIQQKVRQNNQSLFPPTHDYQQQITLPQQPPPPTSSSSSSNHQQTQQSNDQMNQTEILIKEFEENRLRDLHNLQLLSSQSIEETQSHYPHHSAATVNDSPIKYEIANDHSTSTTAVVERPQVIVTPRKIAAAIESAAAAVLAQNNKSSLAECVTANNQLPITLLPSTFNVINMGGSSIDSTSQNIAPGNYNSNFSGSSSSSGGGGVVAAGSSNNHNNINNYNNGGNNSNNTNNRNNILNNNHNNNSNEETNNSTTVIDHFNNYSTEESQNKSVIVLASGSSNCLPSATMSSGSNNNNNTTQIGTFTNDNEEMIPDLVEPMNTSETVDPSTDTILPPDYNREAIREMAPRGQYFHSSAASSTATTAAIVQESPTWDLLLGRWRLSLDLFGRVFMEDVGLEPGSIVLELRGFPVKEARFRRHMEKVRSAQQRELSLLKLERTRTGLLLQTFKEFNTHYNNHNQRLHPPLAFNRVKVTFRDELGEGSGVVRSFYTSIAEALLANEKIPNLDIVQSNTSSSANKYSFVHFTPLLNRRVSYREMDRPRPITQRRYAIGSSISGGASGSGGVAGPSGSGGSGSAGGNTSNIPIVQRYFRDSKLNIHAIPYRPLHDAVTIDNPNGHLIPSLQHLGQRLYLKIKNDLDLKAACKITGMLLELPEAQLHILLGSEDLLRQRCEECLRLIDNHLFRRTATNPYALELIASSSPPPSSSSQTQQTSSSTTNTQSTSSGAATSSTTAAGANTSSKKGMNPIVLLEECHVEDNAPLFYSPGKRGVYSPRQGHATPERLNAFRNVGRLIGLCLLQNELFPLFLQRHVLKYILGRSIRFHDLAFFDPVVYESLRKLAKDSAKPSVVASMELNFVINLIAEEGGGSHELIPGGTFINVNHVNVYDYVRFYANYRMIKTQDRALEAIRLGVFDVLPNNSLDILTSEDLRLLLNGVGDINVGTLISYTTFNDESSETSDKLLKFKRWLWSTVEKMSNMERQDLVYFWTGSPALPSSHEGFHSLPSITIRPADDAHLPTANTCIARLYIPLYSSKAVLRHKLLLAIKTKNFGFV